MHLRILISTGVPETIFHKYQGTAVLLIYLLCKCNRPVRLRFDEVWKFVQSHRAPSNITAGIWSKFELIQKPMVLLVLWKHCYLATYFRGQHQASTFTIKLALWRGNNRLKLKLWRRLNPGSFIPWFNVISTTFHFLGMRQQDDVNQISWTLCRTGCREPGFLPCL